ncbi:MAG: hypothetical protein WA655_08605 [Candidatus Korobacteraceae bacterium]
MLAFGAQQFIYAIFGVGLGPPWTPESTLWTYVTGIVLLATAISIAIHRKGHWGILLACMLTLRLLFLHIPRLAATARDPNQWTSAFEIIAMVGAALVLADTAPIEESLGGPDMTTMLGRSIYAISLLVFAAQHFMYAHFVGALVPSWIPGHLFWANFIGVAFVAAALSILTGVWATLGSTLLGAMFLLWVLLLHAPRVVLAPHDGNEWASAFVALAMSGGAFLMAGSLDQQAVAHRRRVRSVDSGSMPGRGA